MLNSRWWVMIVTIISLLSGGKICDKDIHSLCKSGEKWITELICPYSPSSDNPAALNEKEIPRPSWGLKSSLPGPLHVLYQRLSQAQTIQNSGRSKPSGLGPGSRTGLEENANLTPLGRKYKESGEQAPLFCIVGNNHSSLRSVDEQPWENAVSTCQAPV